MTCRELKFDLIDFARGVALDPSRAAAVERHLRDCAPCSAIVGRQRDITASLRRLAKEQRALALDPARLNSLVAAVGRRRGRSRRATIAVGLSLAASILIVVSLSVGVTREPPTPGSSQAVAATLAPPTGAETAFVVLPGADALPRLESGRVIRIEIPESELTAVGLWSPPHAGVVQADVLVGQDGLARAVRLVK